MIKDHRPSVLAIAIAVVGIGCLFTGFWPLGVLAGIVLLCMNGWLEYQAWRQGMDLDQKASAKMTAMRAPEKYGPSRSG